MEVSSVSTEPPGQARTKLDRLYRGRFEASADGHPGEAGENTLAQTVRKVLYVQLPLGQTSIEQAAQGLGLHVRTLQRHLSAEGVALSELVNEVRRDLVLRCLAQPHQRPRHRQKNSSCCGTFATRTADSDSREALWPEGASPSRGVAPVNRPVGRGCSGRLRS